MKNIFLSVAGEKKVKKNIKKKGKKGRKKERRHLFASDFHLIVEFVLFAVSLFCGTYCVGTWERTKGRIRVHKIKRGKRNKISNRLFAGVHYH